MKYKYTAVNMNNEKIEGVFIAKDEKDLAKQLAKQNLFLVSSSVYSGDTPSAFFTLGTGKITLPELTTFCRQFAIMLTTHIPILDCLDILKNQPFSTFLKKILQVVYEDVKSGLQLSEALQKHKKVFPDFFRNMVRVGEVSGKMDSVFNSIADYYESDSELKRKAKSALSYPIMLLGMTVGIFILMIVMIVPTFKDALSSLDVKVEGITKILYDVSDYFLENWRNILLYAVGIIGLIFLILQTEKGKYAFDVIKLKIPFVKTVTRNMITARFARSFGLLLSSGMDLNDALDAVEIVIGNRYTVKMFKKAADNVRHGMSLTIAFKMYDLFPEMMIQMISIGEKTASLDDVLTRSCTFFDTQVETSLNALISKIQPVMLLIMGGVVGSLFIGVYSPILSIMNGLSI